MNWEAFAAVSTAFTGLVILVTAIVALREARIAAEHSRATRDQLEHLRKATQFEGALAVFAELDTPLQQSARHFVQFELGPRMLDDGFRQEVSLIAGADELQHKELTVLRCFERVGTYVQKGWVDSDVVYMVASGRVMTTWRALEEVVAIHRSVAGPRFWENFEQLYKDCKTWMRSARSVDVETLEERQTRFRSAPVSS
jgi:hypothetical protein